MSRAAGRIPEVVQTSGMDCGPAALAALLRGQGIPASYDWLRDACQTDVDGTSIDVVEEVAVAFGLPAEQVMVPADHVLLKSAACLPCIAVVTLPGGLNHFVVLWRRGRRTVEVMDPAEGRRRLRPHEVHSMLYQHRMPVPTAALAEWVLSSEFTEPLSERVERVAGGEAARVVGRRAADGDWHALLAVDASCRLLTSLIERRAVRSGPAARRVLETVVAAEERGAWQGPPAVVPDWCWTARPAEPAADGAEQAMLHGAVLVRVGNSPAGEPSPATVPDDALERAIRAPGRAVAALIFRTQRRRMAFVVTTAVIAAMCGVASTVLLPRAFGAGAGAGAGASSAARAAVLTLTAGDLLLGVASLALALSAGRRAESEVRRRLHDGLERIGDDYFRSRPASDTAQRAHALHRVREIPELVALVTLAVGAAVAGAVGMIALHPSVTPWVVALLVAALGVPAAFHRSLVELGLRSETIVGALSRFHLDTLVGGQAVRAHAGGGAVRFEHGELLVAWCRAQVQLRRRLFIAIIVGQLAGVVAAVGAVAHLAAVPIDGERVLVAAVLASVVLAGGAQLGVVLRTWPTLRAIALRAAEPLAAIEAQGSPENAGPDDEDAPGGVALQFDGVEVSAGGQSVLRDVEVVITSGEHVAVVGQSGAGKTTLVGLLLGWHEPASGRLLVDGEPLDPAGRTRLRRTTAWVDPDVTVWHRTVADNLRAGTPEGLDPDGELLGAAGLTDLASRGDGLDADAGDEGRLLSGGERQRVRIGRGLARRDARLVVLDEAFRGLERSVRHDLLSRARRWWADATLLCVTHDVADALTFDRVLVIDDGRVVEDGVPDQLAADPRSRFAQLVRSQASVERSTWGDARWRRLRVADATCERCPD